MTEETRHKCRDSGSSATYETSTRNLGWRILGSLYLRKGVLRSARSQATFQVSCFTAATHIARHSMSAGKGQKPREDPFEQPFSQPAAQQLFSRLPNYVHPNSVSTPATQNGGHIDNKMREVI